MTARALLWVALLLMATTARAEPVYVVEQLVVGLSSAPGGTGERVTTVKSGDRLELLERQGDESHVRLSSGTEGWIRSSYLSAEPPLHERLSERTAEVDKLKQDVARLESELTAARRLAAPAAEANQGTVQSVGAVVPASGPAVHEASVFLRSPETDGEAPWMWIVGTALVMLPAGFALGWRVLDRRIRRKYGGLRIY